MPLHLWLSKETVRAWFALFEARARCWHGVSRMDRWAILGGQLVAPVDRQRPPYWVWNTALNQLYLSAYHLAPANIPAYLGALQQHKVVYLLGYPSGLYRLAQVVLEQNLTAPKLKVAIGNAEPLLDHQREAIAAAFGCPVRETYGMAEIAAAAGECETGRLHIWPEAGHIEVLADEYNAPVDSGRAGRLVATGLLNADMPLIRYETGDRATLSAHTCECGRKLPLLESIEGRVDDVVITRDGRHIGRLDPVFKADLPIREAQIIQEDWAVLRVLYVPAATYSAQDGEMLIQRVHDRTGEDMKVILEPVTEIPRTANGKFRAVISHVRQSSPDKTGPLKNSIMTRKSNKHESFVVLGLFVLSLVVSAVFWSLLPAGFRDNQSTDYLNHYEPVARAILAGQGITLEGDIATRYPPGFSMLLAGAFRIGELFNLDDETVLLAFRLFFAGLSVVLVYALGRLIWTSALAFIPALAWLTYPFFLWLTKQPNSEVPFIPFLYASIFVFWLAALHKPRAWGLYLIAGLLAGATMLIRPSALGLGVLMAGLVLVIGHRMLAVRARFWAAGLILMGNLLAVLPWEASVYARTGHVIPLSTGGAITIQDGLTFLAVPKEYRREVRIPDDVAALMWTFHERRPEMASTGDAAAVVLDEARHNPAAFIKLMAIKVARSWYGSIAVFMNCRPF
jgi:phenylacetate-CoA ligase